MEEIREKKQDIRDEVANKIATLSADEIDKQRQAIENRLFEFANFLESRIVLLYTPAPNEVDTMEIIRRSCLYGKIIVLPAFDQASHAMELYKIDDLDKDLVQGPRGNLEPNTKRCKPVPIDCLDIAIVPGIAMDEKGGRIGQGNGYYDRLIPDLPITTRKVGLVYEHQIVPVIPLESHDKYVDIVITEDRVIYKI